MIPRTIHVVWVGDESRRPNRCIDSWRQMNPGYTLRVWGNRDLLNDRWINASHMRNVPAEHIPAVADMMRYEILLKYGGITVDADSMCVRALEDWLMEPACWATWENEKLRPGLITNAFVGSEPGEELLAAVIEKIRARPTVNDYLPWMTTGPLPLTEIWHAMQSRATVYPSHYFTPDHFDGARYSGTGPIFARQLWSSTRVSIEGRGEMFAPYISEAD